MVSLTSFGAQVSALCAQNAIESDRVADKVRDGLNRGAIATLEQKNAEEQWANVMRTGANATQIAQSSVSFVMSCVQIGQSVDAYNEHQRVAPELQRTFTEARANPEARAAFEGADMGGGRTIGERFDEHEIDAMLATERTPEQIATLRRAGFDDREIERLGGPGTADVLGQHTQTPAEKREAERESKIEGAVQGEVWKALEACWSDQAPKAEARAKALGEEADAIRSVADLFTANAKKHLERLDEIGLEADDRARR